LRSGASSGKEASEGAEEEVKTAGFFLAVLAAYLLVCLMAFLFQRRLIYFPVRWSEAEARRWNPGCEEIRIPVSDGVLLHGWLLRKEEAPWTVIIFHGNAGNLSFHGATLEPFRALGLQAVLFDYRGYGLSTGSPTEEGLLRDGEAALNYVEGTLGAPRERIVFFGQSLGAGVATLLAARRPPGRLILESAWNSLAAVARHHYFFLPAGLLLRDRYDSAAVIDQVACPILFLHPGEDEIVPVRLGRALYEKARGPKRFVLLPGAHHNDSFELRMREHLEAIRDFLDLPAAPG
jgi:fermentation-respiration switch protein FrsA (DUF1100 family)